MERTLQVFIIPADRSPADPPRPARTLAIEAPTIDGLREAACEKLAAEGLRVRSLSFGPKGLIAYAEERR